MPAYSVESYRKNARKVLPRAFFDFIDGGAEDEVTMGANRRDFGKFALLPRPLNGAGTRDLSTQVLGKRWSMPVGIAPTGLAGLFWPDGELCAARAAAKASVGICLSHASACSLEEFSQQATSPKWMQTYIYRDRELTRKFADRAKQAGYDALVLTIDNQLVGSRERDLESGFIIPPKFGLTGYLAIASKAPWLWRMRNHIRALNLKNYVQESDGSNMVTVSTRVRDLLDVSMNWDDISAVRDYWDGDLILKGVLSPEEALEAERRGIDAIIISNHGGRQLDCAISTIEALPPIAQALGGRMPILLDSGVRRGSDVFKAVALGATACLIGRPYLWGLTVDGETGVTNTLDILRSELDRVMGLCGTASINDITADYLSHNEEYNT